MRGVEGNKIAKIMLSVALIIIVQNCCALAMSSEEIELTGEAAVVIDAISGDVLYDKLMHQKMYPASTTKIMTALLVLENTSLDEQVTVAAEAAGIEGSSIYLRAGEVLTVEQLLYALLVSSGNDAAVALAIHTAGDLASFVELMNQKAHEVGALNTHFANPNGLPDPDHYTTAYDLAQIAREAINQPKLMEIAGTARYQIPPTNMTTETRYLKNTNRFLWATGPGNKINYLDEVIDIKYDEVIKGIKTGYTQLAGNCLVSLAELGGQKVISVVLKSSGNQLYQDTRCLVDYGLYNFKTVSLLNEGEISCFVEVQDGASEIVGLISDRTLVRSIPIDQLGQINQEITVPDQVTAPIKEGDVIGLITFTLNNEPLGKAYLLAGQAVPRKSKWWRYGILLLLLFGIYKVRSKRKKYLEY